MSSYYNGVFNGDERVIEIGVWEEDTGNPGTYKWVYYYLPFKNNFDPQFGDNTEPVHDRLEYKGSKRILADNTLTLEQRFTGYNDQSLYFWEGRSGLIIRDRIDPDDPDYTVPIGEEYKYYINVSFGRVKDSHSNTGETTISITATFGDRVNTEPTMADNTQSVFDFTGIKFEPTTGSPSY